MTRACWSPGSPGWPANWSATRRNTCTATAAKDTDRDEHVAAPYRAADPGRVDPGRRRMRRGFEQSRAAPPLPGRGPDLFWGGLAACAGAADDWPGRRGAGLDTPRIALARSPLTLDYFAEVAWSDKAPALVRTAMIQAFENSGAFSAVGSDTFSLRTDYLLKSELRNFEAVYDSQSGNPVATVALSLKLVKLPGDTISAQTVISQRQPAASNAIPDIVGAFNIALGKALQEAV